VNFSLIPVAEHLDEIPPQLTGLGFIVTDLYDIQINALLMLMHCCHFFVEMVRQIMHCMFRTEAN